MFPCGTAGAPPFLWEIGRYYINYTLPQCFMQAFFLPDIGWDFHLFICFLLSYIDLR